MLHPSYTDLMEVVNSDVEPGEQPIVQSRYSIVLATAKRARHFFLTTIDYQNFSILWQTFDNLLN